MVNVVGYTCTLALSAAAAARVAITEDGATMVLQLSMDLALVLDSYNALLYRFAVDGAS